MPLENLPVEMRSWMERVQQTLTEQARIIEQQADDFADLCDELGRSNSQLRLYRRRQRLLHRLVVEAFSLPSESVLIVAPRPNLRRASTLSLDNDPGRVGRVVVNYLLRCSTPTVATDRRLKKDYGVRIECRQLAQYMSHVLLSSAHRRAYQQVTVLFAAAEGFPSDWNPEPSYWTLKRNAQQMAVPHPGRPSKSLTD